MFSTGSFGKYFLLRADGLYIIYSSGLKVWVPLLKDTFRLPHPVISAVVSISYHFNYCLANPGSSASPGVWHEIPRPLTATSSSKLIFFTPISADGKRGYFHFGILANHLAFIFSPCHVIR